VAPLFLSRLDECYSAHHHIYTDGSNTASHTGCGIYVEQLNVRQSITINPYASSFSAELYGILRALYCVVTYSTPKALILTDSLSALQAINSRCWTSHIFVTKILLLSSTLVKAGREIASMWVPGHRGVLGNEIADSLARLPTSNNRHQGVSQIRLKTVITCVSYADICQHLRDHFDNVWNTQYQSDPKGISYKAIFPRRRKEDLRLVQTDTATLFRLRTGHCRLHLHFFRLGLHQGGLCDACHTPETVAHFLLVCPQYHAQRAILLAKLRKIGVTANTGDILRNPGASCLVQHFVDATNRTLWTD